MKTSSSPMTCGGGEVRSETRGALAVHMALHGHRAWGSTQGSV